MSRRPSPPKKRRTTLTLPADSLSEPQRIARARKVNLSTVITEALDAGLRLQMAAERRDQVLDSYRNAFAGFSEEEVSVLDGVISDSRAE